MDIINPNSNISLVLRAQHLQKEFSKEKEKITVVKDVSLDIYERDCLAIMGSSGAGKSTLLHMLGTLDRPTSGTISFGAKSANVWTMSDEALSDFRNRNLGFVFQFHYLLPEFSSLENVMMPALISGMDQDLARKKAQDLLAFIGLKDRITHKPGELSGGEQQRVAIARSVILRPKLLLGDEMTGNLDSENSKKVVDLLLDLNKEFGIAILIVTHDVAVASRMKRVLNNEGWKNHFFVIRPHGKTYERVKILTLILAISFCYGSVFAAPISEVKTTGLKRIERDAVLEKITSKPGKEYSAEAIRTDVDTLFGMGYFDDITVDRDGDKLTFAFVERPVINEILFEGNEKIATSDLEGAAKVKKWSILDINKVKADLDILQKQYEEKGYYLAKVTYEVRPDKDGEVKLVYKVADYEKVEIKKIVFLNNKHFDQDKLKGIFGETKEGSSVNFLSSAGTFKEASFKNDLQRLTYYYLEHGFIKFRFENPNITISDDKKYVYISIYVEEGEQYKVGTYDFSGDLLFSKEELKKEIKMTEGQTFSVTGRNADIQRLTEKYQDLGYAFVNVVPKMDVSDENKIVNFDYSFEKGNLVNWGEIHVVGNTKTYDKVIRRELRIYEGELFSGSKLRISKERVERLGFFAPGEVQFNQIPRRGRDDILDLDIHVKERSTGSVTVGAGYSSVQGFFFQGKVQEINLFGSGKSLTFDGQWGKEEQSKSVSISYFDPYAWDSLWSAGMDLFYANSQIPERYIIRRSGFDLRTGYPLTDDIQGNLTYKFEFLSVLSTADNAYDPTLLPQVRVDSSRDVGILSSLTLSATRDKRNNRFETSGGDYQNVSLEVAGLGGTKNFSKFIMNNRYYLNFLGDFVFKNSTEIGAMIDTGGRGVPPSEKFYLGGPWNMRGYEAFALSPVIYHNGGVEKIGGSSELFSLFEIEHPLIKEAGIKGVIFYDIGNAFAGVPGLDTGVNYSLRQNYGFGIRWFSPLGPLRFEWGFPLNRRIDPLTGQLEAGSSFIFFIGQPF